MENAKFRIKTLIIKDIVNKLNCGILKYHILFYTCSFHNKCIGSVNKCSEN